MRKSDCSMLKRRRRGQGAIELMVLVSFFMLFSIPLISLIYLSATQGSQDSSLSQAEQVSRKIIELTDSVYIQGDGAAEKLVVVFPQGMHGIGSNGRELTITVASSAGYSDVVSMGIADIVITGSVGTEAGPHSLIVRSLGDRVEVYEE
ncbi:MAG: hypothetical protein ABIG39_04315 [Candidatus Micrarchaeota archaeon]